MARKIQVKLILELREAGMSRNSIASTRNISRHSVSDVFRIADEKGIHFKDVRDLDETAAYQLFYPEKHAYETMYGDPDYPHVHEELKKTGVTLKLLHEEYVEKCQAAGEIPMGKTKFNEGYADYTAANKLTNHLDHKPGEKAEVDWSGPTMHYVDTTTGEAITLPVCRDASLQPVFVRRALSRHEDGYLPALPQPHVCVFRRRSQKDCMRQLLM